MLETETLPLAERLRSRSAEIAVLGLGFAGLPTAVEFARAGFRVTGFDLDQDRVRLINGGKSPVPDISDSDIAHLIEQNRLRATTQFDRLSDAAGAVICVPTPLTDCNRPDFRYIRLAAEEIAARLRPGRLIILQSTGGPGTTRSILLPILEASGLRVGDDFYVAYAPERIDPGNRRFNIRNTPKLIGGITKSCTEHAALLYRHVVDHVETVSSPEVAELAKLVENTFRFINISLMNEVALLCDRLQVDVWEVAAAAATKPYGFLPHNPGPGVGGHCIPVVPFFLAAAAAENGMTDGLIQAAGRINEEMPRFVVTKLERILAQRRKAITAARVLLLGISYKPEIPDIRGSSSLRVLAELQSRGARIAYHDPYVPEVSCGGQVLRSLTAHDVLQQSFDCAVLLTAHPQVDYQKFAEHIGLIFDTRHHLPNLGTAEIICL